jgi:hypothetical protein
LSVLWCRHTTPVLHIFTSSVGPSPRRKSCWCAGPLNGKTSIAGLREGFRGIGSESAPGNSPTRHVFWGVFVVEHGDWTGSDTLLSRTQLLHLIIQLSTIYTHVCPKPCELRHLFHTRGLEAAFRAFSCILCLPVCICIVCTFRILNTLIFS